MKILSKKITTETIVTHRYTLELEKENGELGVVFIDSDSDQLSDEVLLEKTKHYHFYKKMSKSFQS